MHTHSIDSWQHSHSFLPSKQQQGEKKTWLVLIITLGMMVAEIIGGTIFSSMALLADGWHMATHAGAFIITLLTYHFARVNAQNPQYTFGTGKVTVLGGFASAVALGVIAFITAIESLVRLFHPQTILFNQAIFIAVLGLIVNLISAFLLEDHPHDHHHHHHHDHHHHHQDHNLRAAYFHVLADALTSVLAIFALLMAKQWGWIWMDTVMGLVATFVIGKWAWGLIKDTSNILLDASGDRTLKQEIANIIESDGDNRIADLHLWNLSENHLSASISIVTHNPQSPEYYKNLLKNVDNLAHIIVEVNHCQGESCFPLHQ